MWRNRQIRRRGHVTDSHRVRDPANTGHVRLQDVERLTSDHIVECRRAIQTLAASASHGDVPPEALEPGEIGCFERLLDPVQIAGFESMYPRNRLIDRP